MSDTITFEAMVIRRIGGNAESSSASTPFGMTSAGVRTPEPAQGEKGPGPADGLAGQLGVAVPEDVAEPGEE